MKKAIFLDRDGVINKNADDITTPEKFEMLPGVSEAIKKINDSGYLAIIITNQPIISKGFCTFDDLKKIHDKMNAELAEAGAHIDAIYVCPHHPKKGFEGEVSELKIDCDCRKPKPGLIKQAIAEHDIDTKESWMIGDSPSDIAAGKAAGVKTVLVSDGGGSGAAHEAIIDTEPDAVKKDLEEAVDYIFSQKF